ncbi:hypothetical protein LTR82_017646 [Friedmanniomyces endolithicus]|uniref:Uncharacterized protein n=1 Tax=Friedmanniomyces endolithicus TaxID=329885 RepID=A0AAN6F7M4_9PEZI|nr:hypothetical protein LTR82_017646 [Friedmanniomyces endolithicus]
MEEHVHWYGLDDGLVHFRPSKEVWNSSCSRTWNLVLDAQTTRWRSTKDAGSQILIGLASAPSKALASISSPVADAGSIHIISPPSSPTRSSEVGAPAVRELEIEIPGLQFGFVLQAEHSELRSKQSPKMIVDRDQSWGSLTLIDKLEISAAESQYEKAYVAGLKDSALQLQVSTIAYGLAKRDGLQRDLDTHPDLCLKHVNLINEMLSRTVFPGASPQLGCATALWSIKHWPRVSPTFFLEQLNRSNRPSLSESWKGAKYGLALIALQRAKRLVDVHRAGSETDLINEIRNTDHVNGKPHDYPDSLLLEAESGIMIREIQ